MTVAATPTSSVAPAGWYQDPLGLPQLRWWSGTGWTNHIQEIRPDHPKWSAEFTVPNAPSIA